MADRIASHVLLCIAALFVLKARANECIQGCTTFTKDKLYDQLLSCTIQQSGCRTTNSTTTAGPPVRISGRNDWYLFTEPVDGHVRIALNFSWAPSQDRSIRNLFGYQITISSRNHYSALNYCINTRLNPTDHSSVKFYYDCFGRSTRIKPGDDFVAQIANYPVGRVSYDGNNSLLIPISVPNCDDPRMQEVYECKEQAKLMVTAADETCSNRTRKLIYNVPRTNGRFANIRFCLYRPEPVFSCQEEIFFYQQKPLSGILNVTLPKQFNLSDNYSMTVWGSKPGQIRFRKVFNFQMCATDSISVQPMFNLITMVSVLSVSIILFSITLAAICCRRKQKLSRKDSKQQIAEYSI